MPLAAYMDSGKRQNGSKHPFNRELREMNVYRCSDKNRMDAKILTEGCRPQFNEVRPHSSLEQLTSAEFRINNQPRSNRPFLERSLVSLKPAVASRKASLRANLVPRCLLIAF